MRPRTTGLLLLVALLLGALVYMLEIRSPEQPAAGEAGGSELFPALEAGEVDWLELTTTDERRVRAERQPDGWRIVSPGQWRADAVALDGLVSQLAGLDVQGRVEGEAAPDDFGVGDAAETIRFGTAGARHTLRLGGRTPIGANTYARAGDSAEVVWIATWRANALRKSLTDLRDRRVLDFDHAAVERVEVRWPDGRVVGEKDDAGWRLLAPVEERADRATFETLLSDLAFLQADGFVEEPLAPAESALGEPVIRVALTVEGAVEGAVEGGVGERVLRVGGLRGEQRIAAGSGDALFLIDADRLDDLPRDVLAYRFKALGEFDVAAARGLSLTLPGEAPAGETIRLSATLAAGRWQTAPEHVAEERVREIVSALSRLTARAIVAEQVGDHELAALGLAPPRMRARVTGQGGEVLADVSLGLRQAGRGVLAKRADSPILYRVDETVADRLPIDAADFEARFVGEVDPPDDAEEPFAPEFEDADETPEDSGVGGLRGADLRGGDAPRV